MSSFTRYTRIQGAISVPEVFVNLGRVLGKAVARAASTLRALAKFGRRLLPIWVGVMAIAMLAVPRTRARARGRVKTSTAHSSKLQAHVEDSMVRTAVAVVQNPGALVTQVAAAASLSATVAQRQLVEMERAQLVTLKRQEGHLCCYPLSPLRAMLADVPPGDLVVA